MLFDYDPVAKNLSAEAAPMGGLPALPLLNNGHYTETAAGDFAVTANLPPVDQQNFWLISADFSIDGVHLFGGQQTYGPISVTEAIDDALGMLSPAVQRLIEAQAKLLLTQPQHSNFGLFDWSYIRDPADDLTGTFAFGSSLDLPMLVTGHSFYPPGVHVRLVARRLRGRCTGTEPGADIRARAARPRGAAVADGAPR
ncbi:MAG: hypothetical protein JOY83_24975 [Alphaproteobacteria bacterium]|nr:hypothetical protein [Alphaproteobacteria bacterium]